MKAREEKESRFLVNFLERMQRRRRVHRDMHWLLRLLVVLVGFVVLFAGFLMLVLPGPAIIVIPIGLAVLSLEFAWAERMLNKALQEGISFSGKFKKLFVTKHLFLVLAVLLFAAALLLLLLIYFL